MSGRGVLTPQTILALDLSHHTGAWYDTIVLSSSSPIHFDIDKERGSHEEFLVKLASTLAAFFKSNRVDLVAIENYSFSSFGRGKTILAEIGGVAKLEIQKAKLPFVLVSPPQWKSISLGNGRLTKDQIKEAVGRFINTDFLSQDCIDAYGIWRATALSIGQPTSLHDALYKVFNGT